jgi:hypothetical protein
MAETMEKFRVGDLVSAYPSRGRIYEGNIGVAIEIFSGRMHDEPHVKIRLPDGSEDIRDVRGMRYSGKPVERRGRVIVKWVDGWPEGTSLHQEWSAEMFTDEGWALARDPWGRPHWLPPRGPSGDVQYVFRHLDKRYVVAMQTVL